jgi:hypothetical protein
MATEWMTRFRSSSHPNEWMTKSHHQYSINVNCVQFVYSTTVSLPAHTRFFTPHSIGLAYWMVWKSGFLDIVHHLYFNKITTFRKLDLLPSSGKKGGRAETLAVGPPGWASLRPVQCPMYNVQKTAITDCNTPSSEPFRLLNGVLLI